MIHSSQCWCLQQIKGGVDFLTLFSLFLYPSPQHSKLKHKLIVVWCGVDSSDSRLGIRYLSWVDINRVIIGTIFIWQKLATDKFTT
jgi:hypothetical protein